MMYVLSRMTYHSSLLGGIILFTFSLFHAIPSDPARVILGPNASEDQVQALRQDLGLDAPLPVQFASYLQRLARFDFGNSYVDRRAVSGEVAEKLKVSLLLLGMCAIIILVYVATAVAMEFLLARRLAGPVDFLLTSTPTFFSGIVIALLAFRLYPFSSFSGLFNTIDDALYCLPPALVLAFYPMASLSRIVRGEIDKIQGAPYIRTAKAFGFSEREILCPFILKNAMVPFLAAMTNQIPILFTGAFIVEVIFSLPGIGTLLIKSLLQRDFPMLEGIVILSGMIVIGVHLMSELLYPIIDPRMRTSNASLG